MKRWLTGTAGVVLAAGMLPQTAVCAVSNAVIGYGQGTAVDAENRPLDALAFDQQYAAYGAYATTPDRTRIILTFDQGYENGYTGQILDTLREKHVSAIFFLTGDYAKREADLVQRMIAEGHMLGNHGMTHASLPQLTAAEAEAEIMDLHRYVLDTYGYEIVENEKGLKGIKDKDGTMILECQYKKIEVTNDGFAYCYIRKKVGRKEWIDLQNRLWFANKPQSVKLMGIDFCTEDGKKLYPRILSKYIDEKTYLTVKTLELQVGTGLSWKHRFIPWDEPNKVYMCQERKDRSRLYIDENEQYYVQKNIGSQLEKVDSREELAEFAQKDKEERKECLGKLKNSYKHYEYYPGDNLYPVKKYLGTAKDKITIEKDGIWHVDDAQANESYWVDPITHRKHYTRPVLFKRGYLNILKEGEWCYVRNIPGLRYRPLRQWEIVADDNICVINNKYLIEKSEPDQWYKICRRTDDFSYFSVLACFYESEYIKDDTEIQITQFDGEGLKMTQEGMPYTPIVIKTRKRSKWL